MKDSPPNVLLTYKYVDIGGVKTYLELLGTSLLENGSTIYLLSGADEHNMDLLNRLGEQGIVVVPIRYSPNRILFLFRFIKKVWSLLSSTPIDLIHSHHRLTHLGSVCVSFIKNIPLLITVHEFKSDQKFATDWWKRHPITVPSSSLKKHLIQTYGVGRSNISVIPNAIESEYTLDHKKVGQFRRRFFSEAGMVYVVFIGRIANEKGVDTILESRERLKRDHPDIQFRIVGDGPQLDSFKKRIRKNGDDPDRIFLGRQEDINEILYLCDIAVSPSRSESFSIFALEAMRASKPIIASAVGGLPEVVDDGQTGILIPPDNSQKLADAITDLAANHQKRKEMGEKAARRFKNEFSIDTFTKAYSNLYKRLVR